MRRSRHAAMAPLTVPHASWVLSTASGRVGLEQSPEWHKVKRPEAATQWDPRGHSAASSTTEVLGQQAQRVRGPAPGPMRQEGASYSGHVVLLIKNQKKSAPAEISPHERTSASWVLAALTNTSVCSHPDFALLPPLQVPFHTCERGRAGPGLDAEPLLHRAHRARASAAGAAGRRAVRGGHGHGHHQGGYKPHTWDPESACEYEAMQLQKRPTDDRLARCNSETHVQQEMCRINVSLCKVQTGTTEDSTHGRQATSWWTQTTPEGVLLHTLVVMFRNPAQFKADGEGDGCADSKVHIQINKSHWGSSVKKSWAAGGTRQIRHRNTEASVRTPRTGPGRTYSL